MSKRKFIRVSYSVKNDTGFIVDRNEKFSNIREAMEFIHMFKHLMIGKPIFETVK